MHRHTSGYTCPIGKLVQEGGPINFPTPAIVQGFCDSDLQRLIMGLEFQWYTEVRIHVVVEFDHLVDPLLLLEIQQRNHNKWINKFKSLFGWIDIKRYKVMRLTLHSCIQLDPKGIFAYQTNTNLRVVDSTFSFNWVVVWWWFGFFVQFSQDTAATPKYSRNGACPIQEYSWKMFVLSN